MSRKTPNNKWMSLRTMKKLLIKSSNKLRMMDLKMKLIRRGIGLANKIIKEVKEAMTMTISPIQKKIDSKIDLVIDTRQMMIRNPYKEEIEVIEAIGEIEVIEAIGEIEETAEEATNIKQIKWTLNQISESFT